jgi:1-deoxy-D-xylulose-5-phosphate reductoisomerase
VLTASGGAFRDTPPDRLGAVTLAQALKHPNWDMGPKVTIDSATMANKGLEIIEARWLFDLPVDRIDVVVHPQSIIHSMVTLKDGSLQALLSPPSMAYPIQDCLLYPHRLPCPAPRLDLSVALTLSMSPPDPVRYPCLGLARSAARTGGTAPAIFNAANEVAVAAFVEGRLGFTGIAELVAATLAACPSAEPASLAEVLAADTAARQAASRLAPGLAR